MNSFPIAVALPTIVPTAKATPLSYDLPFYLGGLLLLLLPFSSTQFILIFSLFTMVFYLMVIGLLTLDRFKPQATPNFFKFVHEEEQLVIEFNDLVEDIIFVSKTKKVSTRGFSGFVSKLSIFSIRVLLFMPKFFEKLLILDSGSP